MVHRASRSGRSAGMQVRSLLRAPRAGDVQVPPRDRGEQGIQADEATAAVRLTSNLLRAPGTQFVASVRDGVYQLSGREGTLRWRRVRGRDGALAYVAVGRVGRMGQLSADPRALPTLAAEIAASGGPARPSRHTQTSYPDLMRRVTQMFDHERAPDIAILTAPGGLPEDDGAKGHPGGSHGNPDIVQSRAPLIIAGPGVRSGAVIDTSSRMIDVAPTIAQYLGVAPVAGPADSSAGTRFLKGQDGTSIAAHIAAAGASVSGAAKRALVIVMDGTNANVLRSEMAAGRLPNISALAARGSVVDGGSIAEMPTITWTNHNSLMTGAEPGRHGIVNNAWYERATRREIHTVDGTNTSVWRTGRHLDRQVETLYEAVRRTFGASAVTAAINEPSGRGATISTLDLAGLGTIVQHAPAALVKYLRSRGTGVPADEPRYRKIGRLDHLGVELLRSLYAGSDAPKLAVLELDLVDEMGHAYGSQSSQARSALAQCDANVGAVLRSLADRGELDSTMVVLTADHGNEHQNPAPSRIPAAIASSGVKARMVDGFVYLQTMRCDVQATASSSTIHVSDGDMNAASEHPPVSGALVVVSDARGRRWKLTTDAAGDVVLPAELAGKSVDVRVAHASFTDAVTRVRIPVAGAATRSIPR